MREQENEELARWAGISPYTTIPPDYFSDMNAGIRDLVPKLNQLGYLVRLDYCQGGRKIAHLEPDYWSKQKYYACEGENMSEAFAEACLELAKEEKP